MVIIPDKTSQSASFGEFMVKVMELEDAALAQNYSFMDRITALRLIYYPNRPVKEYGGTTLGGGPWPLLIPGAANVQMPSSWSKPPLENLVRQLRKAQVVEIGGMEVDVGHLLAGLDASLRPSKVTLKVATLPAMEMRSNHEASTYVGDLGSVVAKYAPTVFRLLWEKVEANAVFQKTYAAWASEADNLGNIDSFSMSLNPQRTVTQNLLDYYLAQTGGVRKRVSTFIDAVKLTRPETRTALANEVFTAAQFVLAGDKNVAALMALYQQSGASLERPRAVIFSEVVTLTLATFIDWCQKRARSE